MEREKRYHWWNQETGEAIECYADSYADGWTFLLEHIKFKTWARMESYYEMGTELSHWILTVSD